MRIRIVSPAAPGVTTGNRVTAARWSLHLRGLGHGVRITPAYARGPCDLLIALHAHKSAASVERFAARHPDRPIVVALTGTDVYGDVRQDATAMATLCRAQRIVALQPLATAELPDDLRDRVHVIYQSVHCPASKPAPRQDAFEACVVGHLREVKDPFLAARAMRLMPPNSRVCVTHVGAALDGDMEAAARRETRENRRYEWVGPRSRSRTLQVIARARVLLLTSWMEGGANVVSEAVVCGTPVLSTHIGGSIGLLGEDYPGYFPVGDAESLARLLTSAETEPAFLDGLASRCRAVAPLFDPQHERASWKSLLASLPACGPRAT